MLLLTTIFFCVVFFILFFFLKDGFAFICTLITLSFYLLFFLSISMCFLINYHFINSAILIYIIPTFILVTYLYFGVFINKATIMFFSRKFASLKNVNYNFNILRHSLILIFLIIFIYLNLNGFFYRDDLDDTIFLVRNVFLTTILLAMINPRNILDIDSISNRWIDKYKNKLKGIG